MNDFGGGCLGAVGAASARDYGAYPIQTGVFNVYPQFEFFAVGETLYRVNKSSGEAWRVGAFNYTWMKVMEVIEPQPKTEVDKIE